jgi:hypothetical protein
MLLAAGCWLLATGNLLLANEASRKKQEASSNRFGNRFKLKYNEFITGDSGILQAQ